MPVLDWIGKAGVIANHADGACQSRQQRIARGS